MKKITLYILAFLFITPVLAQRTFEDYYVDGMKYAERGNYKEAIDFFDMALRLKSDDFSALQNRGITKSKMGNYKDAIEDFKQVIKLKPDYVDTYLSLGSSYKLLTYFDTAVQYYSTALELESDNKKALYFRAHMYEAMCMFDSAAADFIELDEMQVDVGDKVKYYKDTAKNRPKNYVISKLTQTATDATYGFSSKNPIKVGTGAKGGFANVRDYLNLLRDNKKKPVTYTRIKACCPYKPKGFTGNVTADEYDVTYVDETGVQVTKKLYFSYYEYEDPKIPIGFLAAK